MQCKMQKKIEIRVAFLYKERKMKAKTRFETYPTQNGAKLKKQAIIGCIRLKILDQ